MEKVNQSTGKGATMKSYLVQGCGVSLICQAGESMKSWINYIIERGGVPSVTLLGELV